VAGSFISSNKIGYRRSEDHVNVSGGICLRVKETGDKKTNYGEFDPGSG
jgi:hypothetical protein